MKWLDLQILNTYKLRFSQILFQTDFSAYEIVLQVMLMAFEKNNLGVFNTLIVNSRRPPLNGYYSVALF